KTTDFVKSVKPAQIDGSEGREIVIPVPNQPLTFTGQSYLVHFALPNLHFHATAAYAILRHCGVEVGKRDYIGKLPSCRTEPRPSIAARSAGNSRTRASMTARTRGRARRSRCTSSHWSAATSARIDPTRRKAGSASPR